MPDKLPLARIAPLPGGAVERGGFRIEPLEAAPSIARANSAEVREAANTAAAYDCIITALENAQATIATYEEDMANGDELSCRNQLADLISDAAAFKDKWNAAAERLSR